MFSKKELIQIWDEVNCCRAGLVKDGKLTTSYNTEIKIPDFEELAEISIENLKKVGYSVKRVSPRQANCIVRVFRHTSIKFEEDEYWLFGAETYLKTILGMTTVCGLTINYSEFKVRLWLFQDDSFLAEPNFVDYFFKIH